MKSRLNRVLSKWAPRPQKEITFWVLPWAVLRQAVAPGEGVTLKMIFSPSISAVPRSSLWVFLLTSWGLIPPNTRPPLKSAGFRLGTILQADFTKAQPPIRGKSKRKLVATNLKTMGSLRMESKLSAALKSRPAALKNKKKNWGWKRSKIGKTLAVGPKLVSSGSLNPGSP